MRPLAKLISTVFHPLLMCTWIVLLFGVVNKYAFGAAETNKTAVVVFANTFFFPAFTMLLMYFLDFIPDLKMKEKKDRTIPFIATMTFYIWSYMVVKQMQMPIFVQFFVLGFTVSIAMAFMVNIFTRLSVHMAGMGAVLMLLMLVAFTGSTDVGHILAAAIVLTGLVGTARLLLTDVTITQLYYGLLIGIFGQMIAWFVGGAV